MPTLAVQLTTVSSWALRSFRRRGLRSTVGVAYSSLLDLGFDWRYGTETRSVVLRTDMEPELENRDRAVSYQPTKERPFLHLMHRLPLPPGSTFVDVGCGKGRVLLLAAQLSSLARVVGVEFSPKLCAQARGNIQVFRASGKLRAPIEVIQADAAKRVPDPSENVFFLYNPFDAAILRLFLDRLRESLAAHPRQVWILYSVPVHAGVLDVSGVFSRTESYTLGGNHVYVYTNK